MARQRKVKLSKTDRKLNRTARTRKWWDGPLGAVLTLGGLALAALILAGTTGTAANLSKHVLGASLVFAILAGIGLALLVPKNVGWFVVGVLWVVPVAFVWMGVENWLDWHEFYDFHGRHRVTSPGGAKVQGIFLCLVGLGGFAFWVAVTRESLKARRRRPRN